MGKVCETCKGRDLPFCSTCGVYIGFLLKDRYSFLKVLGNGGTAGVWKAFDMQEDVPVAIKVLERHQHDDETWNRIVQRGRKEARYLEQIDSPNVVKLVELVEEEECLFLVLEFLDGDTLKNVLREKRPCADVMVFLITEICQGLEAIHEQELIHRDLKASNIMLTKDGRVVLIDLGIARALLNETRITKPGKITGTWGCMAPEQLTEQPLSTATDFYAFGVLIFELATGNRLFKGKVIDVLMAHMSTIPPYLLDRLPPFKKTNRIWQRISKVTAQCLQKSADERFSSSQELLCALQP